MGSHGVVDLRTRLGNAQKCRTGSPVIDRRLQGGVPCNSITEFISEAGVGKTQFCLQLALQAHLPVEVGGLSGSCLYFVTDYYFPMPRLVQLANGMTHSGEGTNVRPIETVFVKVVEDANGMLEELERAEVVLSHSRAALPVRMIIIDSITALVRSQFRNTPVEMSVRQSRLRLIARRLRSLACRYNLAVVTTNQVRDFFATDRGDGGLGAGYLPALYTSGRRVVPALGVGWANMVDTRFFLAKSWKDVAAVDGEGYVRVPERRFWILTAAHLRRGSIEFEISNEGVRGIPGPAPWHQ